jgi:hypothetical protein
MTRTLRSYHLRAQVLKCKFGHGGGVEAWEQTEREYFEITGKMRYKSYDSFRNHHHCFIQELKKRQS